MIQPSFVTEPSLVQVKIESAATATPSGPVLPWYGVPPMVTWSQQLSVSNWVAVNVPAALARMEQASSSPCSPAPSVAHPFASIWQKLAPDATVNPARAPSNTEHTYGKDYQVTGPQQHRVYAQQTSDSIPALREVFNCSPV